MFFAMGRAIGSSWAGKKGCKDYGPVGSLKQKWDRPSLCGFFATQQIFIDRNAARG
jgi:hypothetical protein